MNPQAHLESKLGIRGVELRCNLSKEQLFHESVANDRGRVKVGGPDDERKAFAT
ncbi:MAG: hypothetical protein H6983_24130, partial [Ectothiorhodospiraceae bacterium]|nr:hypothetical protein [Ectothiorhodospiraceae bacterium]